MKLRLLYIFLLLGLIFHPQEAGFVVKKDIVIQIHPKRADGRRIFFVRGNCDSNKFYSMELQMCVKTFNM